MRKYIRENLKNVISITLLIVATTLFICSNELIAKKLPEASELIEVACTTENGSEYEYTGNEVEPTITEVFFYNSEGELVRRKGNEFSVLKYNENVELGTASIEVQIDGYNGSAVIVNAFKIVPGTVRNLKSSQTSQECVVLTWDKVAHANGYLICRSEDEGKTYQYISVVDASVGTTFEDTDISCNTTYLYKVCAFMQEDDLKIYGANSNVSRHTTYIETPVLTGAENKAYNSLQISWDTVEGATGYQVYRSEKADGEFTCIAELEDGSLTSYVDETCSCGTTYYYYIKASQLLGRKDVFGLDSNVVSARTTPNQVRLKGSVSSGDTAVSLSWGKAAGAQGYEVYKSVGSAGSYQLVATLDSADTLSWSESGLDKDTRYYYRVRSYCTLNDEKIVGSYSNTFEKEVVIVYNYSGSSGDVSAITQYSGVPYVWGGKTSSGWDCSGFTYWVYKNHFGIDIGLTAAVQARQGATISTSDRSAWQPGDLLVYTEGAGASHVAIYLGDGQLMHALSPKYDTLVQGVDYYERWDTGTSLMSVKRIFN